MIRILSALALALVHFSAYADVAPEPPIETNYVGTAIFGVLFVGLCVAFVWMVWRNDKIQKRKAKEEGHGRAAGPTS